MVRLALTKDEANLLEDIQHIAHGDLYRLETDGGPPLEAADLHPAQAACIKALRAEGRLDRLVIHQGLPSYAEVHGKTAHGRACTRKIKFN